MAGPYSLALAQAKKELAAAKVEWDNLDKYIDAGEKELRELRDKRSRAMGEHGRLARLCSSLEAAGGVE